MVSMPPRHGKSMLVSQLFPGWYLGRNPTREVVQAGYSIDIALEHSRKARDSFACEQHERVFPAALHAAAHSAQERLPVPVQAASQWGTVHGGRYRAVGVGGGLTGFGAHLAIIDDPVKNREEAESARITQSVWDWYRSTLYTRLTPGGAIILCMTRWAKGDLAGRLLDEAQADGDNWVELILPAIDTNGFALWPERFPLDRLNQIRAAIGQHEWSALYMQEPVLRGGNMLRAELIRTHDSESEFPDTRYVRFWDLASTKKERAKDDPDYTVGALCGVTKKDGVLSLWIKHLEVFQSEAPERNARIVATAERDGPTVPIFVESVAGYKDAYTTIRDILQGRRTVRSVDVSQDKVIRASAIEPTIAAGNCHIARGDWNRILIDQMAAFPGGTHDDCVDAVSGAFTELTRVQPGFFDRAKIGI